MAERACVKRLQKEYRALCKEPVSNVVARPHPNDILDWHYVLEGSQGTPFAGGYYYGKIKFPPEYPFKPPGISMTTPNGRFMTQKKICLSMSDFHPESWNPMWSVSSILTGLLSFMVSLLIVRMDNSPTTGSVSTTDEEKQRLAKSSLAFNCKNATFRKLFPEYVEKYEEQLAAEQSAEEAAPASIQDENSGPALKRRGAKEEARMNEAPIYYESADYCGYEFDHQEDFTEVLEEARKNAFHGTINTTNLEPARKKQIDGEIKKRKSWKKSLFSWLRTDRKTKSTKHPTNGNAVSKPKRGHVSGPVLESEGCVATGKARKGVSVPLASLFRSTRTAEEEHEVPYMCLSQLNNPRKVKFYGPVYSVT
ncbi:hypothetical protein BUALT_Bualt02G0126900 [Buddleja alternifolia]|uniref:E2 ubiquitin-conjugating enzyme n=1 Tax=Buddleja alternifolia TaxID=168488 RepID=A0AAV6YAE4_9LAMI|nr:hypothetical protein BUALT_Bualt02G0126900 [Buddleja alternifolia]